MAKLIYSSIASLDGYLADQNGDFSWAAPDEEVHRFVNDLERPIGTYLYGRRMYEVMSAWETIGLGDDDDDADPVSRDFGDIWRAADKVVYSTSLEAAATARTEVERTFDPKMVRRRKATAGADLSVGGPHLAAAALRARLVDELQVFVVPVVVGGGTAYLPEDLRLTLALVAERRFASGVVYLRYSVAD